MKSGFAPRTAPGEQDSAAGERVQVATDPRSDTVVSRLERHAGERPDAPAIVSLERSIDFRELHARVVGCADWLRSCGVERGERVGVTIYDEPAHLVVALALAALGAAHVTLATHDPPGVRARLAQRVGTKRVVASPESGVSTGPERLDWDPERLPHWGRSGPRALPSPDPDGLLTIFSTSGTTGEAKLIPVTQRRLVRQSERAVVGRVLSLSSIEYHWVERQFLYAICAGTSIVLRGDIPTARSCAALGVDLVACMNAQAQELIDRARTDGRFPPPTALLVSGSRGSAPFRRQLIEQVADRVGTTYSMQECGSIARVIERGVENVTETAGRPHPGVAVEIVGTDGRPVPAGGEGEIRVRAPGMATGYLDDPSADARHFRDGWLCPGDLASFTPDGALVIHGRADDVMSLHSIKIAPQEIERALESHPAIRAVAAFALPSDRHGEIPCAAVELVAGATCDEHELRRYAHQAMGLRAPRRVMVVGALPVTRQGKVDRRRLAELALGSAQ